MPDRFELLLDGLIESKLAEAFEVPLARGTGLCPVLGRPVGGLMSAFTDLLAAEFRRIERDTMEQAAYGNGFFAGESTDWAMARRLHTDYPSVTVSPFGRDIDWDMIVAPEWTSAWREMAHRWRRLELHRAVDAGEFDDER